MQNFYRINKERVVNLDQSFKCACHGTYETTGCIFVYVPPAIMIWLLKKNVTVRWWMNNGGNSVCKGQIWMICMFVEVWDFLVLMTSLNL